MTTSGRSGSSFGVDRGGVGDVELGAAEADHVVAGVAGGEHHVAAEHPGGACDQHLHRDPPLESVHVETGYHRCRKARRSIGPAAARPISDRRRPNGARRAASEPATIQRSGSLETVEADEPRRPSRGRSPQPGCRGPTTSPRMSASPGRALDDDRPRRHVAEQRQAPEHLRPPSKTKSQKRARLHSGPRAAGPAGDSTTIAGRARIRIPSDQSRCRERLSRIFGDRVAERPSPIASTALPVSEGALEVDPFDGLDVGIGAAAGHRQEVPSLLSSAVASPAWP